MAGVILIIVVIAIVIVFVEIKTTRKGSSKEYHYSRKDFFMSRAEHECYDALVRAVGDKFYVFPQVHLPSIINWKNRGQKGNGAFWHISQKSVDFVLCDKAYISPKLAIELDDQTHGREDRFNRDREVERVLAEAGLPLLRIENHGHFNVDELLSKITITMSKKYKILLVDDDLFLTEMFARKFSKVGVDTEVINVPDNDFVEQVVKIKPDLISMDILMPKISGFEAVQMIKADTRTKDIPVIFLSNFSQEKEMMKGLAFGAVDFLVTAYVIFEDLIKSYLGYLNNPKEYIQRYPVYLEVQKMKFSGRTDEEVSKQRVAFMQKRFAEMGIR